MAIDKKALQSLDVFIRDDVYYGEAHFLARESRRTSLTLAANLFVMMSLITIVQQASHLAGFDKINFRS